MYNDMAQAGIHALALKNLTKMIYEFLPIEELVVDAN